MSQGPGEGGAPYQQRAIAGWGDMDFNSHMRNTAYLDKSVDVRMMYFVERGFPMSEFVRRKFGPVVLKDELEYFREIHLLEEITITLHLAGLSEDGSRLVMRNDFLRKETPAARVRSTIGWLDLANRKLVCPPEELLEALRDLTRSDDFVTLPGLVRPDRG